MRSGRNSTPLSEVVRIVDDFSIHLQKTALCRWASGMSGRNALLVVTEDGYRKRVPLDLLRGYQRGMIKIRALGRRLTLAAEVGNLDQVHLTSSQEKVIQLAVSGVPIMGRKARGARVMRLQSGERVTAGAVRSLSR